jgi:transmembrane sensor
MSGANSALQDAKSIGMEAAAWIQRRDFDHWTEADAVALETWLTQSPAHRVAFFRLDMGWQRTTRLAALRSSETAQTKSSRGRRVLSALFGAGLAAAAIAVLFSGGLYFVRQMNRTSYATAVGAREVLTLKDGSQVELNTDTRIQVSDDAREVWLDSGEAYFQVKHDASHPFIVKVGTRRITDLGTKFVIRRDGPRMQVAVLEGGVQLNQRSADGRDQSAVLKPGDVAIATDTSFSVSKKPQPTLAEELSWRSGLLVFHHTTLAEAAEEINRYSGKKLVIADSSIGHFMIGGTFPINNVMAIAEAAQDSLGLRVDDRGDEVVISR